MKRALLLGLLVSSPALIAGTELNVTFTGTLRDVTCDIKIEGGTGDGANNTIPIGVDGKINVMDIINGSSAAGVHFKLKIIDCPNALTVIKTRVAGTASGYVNTALISTAATDPAEYVGLTIARASAPDAPFEINSTDDSKSLIWTYEEFSNMEVSLIARLIETKPGYARAGNFSAVATFNFEYQ